MLHWDGRTKVLKWFNNKRKGSADADPFVIIERLEDSSNEECLLKRWCVMHLLITGGAGFIGSNFVHYMMDKHKDIEITVVDKLTYAGNIGNLNPLLTDSRLRFVKGSINDKELIEELVTDVDYLINFASESHVDRSIQDASPFIKTNVDGVRNMLDVIKNNKKVEFIQISTDEVYGASIDDEYKFEKDCLCPGNPYSASKASAEMFVQSYINTFGIQAKIVRLTNNSGPRQNKEKLIPKTINNFISGDIVPIYGTGEQSRDWIYVDDSCCAIEKVLFKGKTGSVYNISTMIIHTNNEIVELILNLLKSNSELIEYVEDRLGHDFKYLVNSDKIRCELEWSHQWNLEQGMKETLKWYTNDN